ncbi:MAG: hypothetical protein AM1032_000031 [Mycoplasmataceae bacterium]|nr:MAG: hypothetical protein AM1032_000031 [Mycoplasmataceae bacterium]
MKKESISKRHNLKILFSFIVLFLIIFFYFWNLSKFDEENNIINHKAEVEENNSILHNDENEQIYEDPEELKIEKFDQDVELSEIKLIRKKNNKRMNSSSFKSYNFYVCRELKCEEGTTSEFCNNHRCTFREYNQDKKFYWPRCESIKASKDGNLQKYCKNHYIHQLNNKQDINHLNK